MIFETKIDGFSPRFEVVSCFTEHEGAILMLLRLPTKSQGGKWGVPAGKLEVGETPLDGMVRELAEETGISVLPEHISFLETLYVRHGGYDFIYHMFSLLLQSRPEVLTKKDEHEDFEWVSPIDALSMPLVEDLDDCIKRIYRL
ncbi:MAG: NUDIX hydrolase [Minisyncoccia bacterium]